MTKYITGFVISIVLTLTAYLAVTERFIQGWWLVFFIVGLAMVQLVVQLVFFLHLNFRENQRWNLAAFLSTAGIIFILVVGSLWIMNNLNYRHMSPGETDSYIQDNEAIRK